jgi:bifunctional enzyme CysN/CysC/sulfate adenylyltransferase subunit 1
MNINVVIVGHVDHGKSTLIGRLLYDSGTLPEDKLAEIQKLLEEYKKRFEFAYFLDSFEEELKEERTLDTTRVLFKGKNYYTVVDVPGHKEFIKNMLTGASHAQVGILVISALDGIQEQTRRHAFLLHMLGIKQILVAINKMDLVDYCEEVFHRVKEETALLLSSLGYSGAEFIPISAMNGDNVYKPSEKMEWYKGSTLIQALDKIELEKVAEKPLRFVVQDVYFIDSEKVTVGRVESGTLRKGDNLIFQPSGVRGKVEKIKIFPGEAEMAGEEESIGILMECEPKRGDVGGHQEDPPNPVDRFLGEIVLLEGTLKSGDEFEMKCGTKKTRCTVEQIKERINSETGEVIGEEVMKIEEGEAAVVAFKTEPIVVEKFAEIPELGRFVLVKKGKNIGAGVVLEVKT